MPGSVLTAAPIGDSAARQNDRPLPAWVPTVAAAAFAVYRLRAAIQHAGA
jgi:hypothetical protein